MQPTAPPNPSRLPEHFMHKNRLQEYAQRSALPLPTYLTINEGSPHAPKFRSTVVVGGMTYKTVDTFLHRKEAEQNAAKLALESILKQIKDEGCPLIHEDTIFCKSILNEFAVKMNLQQPTYKTTQSEGLLPVFISTLIFDGKTYCGDAGKNKKEAEQLAARAVIQSILGNSSSGPLLSQIINSKTKLYAALHKVKNYGNSNVSMGINLVVGTPSNGRGRVIHNSNPLPIVAAAEASGQFNHATETHLSKKPKLEPTCEAINRSIGTPQLVQPLCVGQVGAICWPSGSNSGAQSVNVDTSTGGKRPRKNKKRAQKKIGIGEQLQGGVYPINQTPSCSVTY